MCFTAQSAEVDTGMEMLPVDALARAAVAEVQSGMIVGLGTGKHPSGRPHPCLIALARDSQTVWMFGPEYAGVTLQRELFKAHATIASIKTCPFAKIIAFTTEDGGFGIYSTPLRQMLYQSSPKDRGDD